MDYALEQKVRAYIIDQLWAAGNEKFLLICFRRPQKKFPLCCRLTELCYPPRERELCLAVLAFRYVYPARYEKLIDLCLKQTFLVTLGQYYVVSAENEQVASRMIPIDFNKKFLMANPLPCAPLGNFLFEARWNPSLQAAYFGDELLLYWKDGLCEIELRFSAPPRTEMEAFVEAFRAEEDLTLKGADYKFVLQGSKLHIRQRENLYSFWRSSCDLAFGSLDWWPRSEGWV